MPELSRNRPNEELDRDEQVIVSLLTILINEQRITNVYLRAMYGENLNDRLEEFN